MWPPPTPQVPPPFLTQVSEPSISMHMIIDRFSGFLLTLVERLRVLPENQLTRPSKQTRDVNLLNLQFAEKLYKFVERA